jgi:hypothetical protein
LLLLDNFCNIGTNNQKPQHQQLMTTMTATAKRRGTRV